MPTLKNGSTAPAAPFRRHPCPAPARTPDDATLNNARTDALQSVPRDGAALDCFSAIRRGLKGAREARCQEAASSTTPRYAPSRVCCERASRCCQGRAACAPSGAAPHLSCRTRRQVRCHAFMDDGTTRPRARALFHDAPSLSHTICWQTQVTAPRLDVISWLRMHLRDGGSTQRRGRACARRRLTARADTQIFGHQAVTRRQGECRVSTLIDSSRSRADGYLCMFQIARHRPKH